MRARSAAAHAARVRLPTHLGRRSLATSSSQQAPQAAIKPAEEEPYRPSVRQLKLEGQAIVTEDPTGPRINPVGIQLLSQSFHEQIFPRASRKTPDIIAVETSIAHLRANELLKTAPPVQSAIEFPLPPLMGENIDEHFHNMGLLEAEPYLSMAERFAATPPLPLPKRFAHASGWTRYDPATGEATAVPYPEDESMLTFDVEVLYKINPYPIMAAAMSPTHWYTWLSPWLLGESTEQEHLCPLGPADTERIVVGHNVGYDRIRIKEEYSLAGSKNRFLDTMSFHSASQGVSAPQRGAWRLHQKTLAETERLRVERLEELETEAESLRERIAEGEIEEVIETTEQVYGDDYDYSAGGMFPEVTEKTVLVTRNLADRLRRVEADLVDIPLPVAQAQPNKRFLSLDVFGEKTDAEPEYEEATDADVASADRGIRTWEDLTAMSSLEEVFKLHFPDETINKTTRNAFAAEDRSFILEDLQNLIHYCASDVHATHRVYSRTLPRYRRLCPSPASFAGMLVMGSAFLPVNKSWDRYVKASEAKFLELDGGIRQKLASLAESARERWTPPPDDFRAVGLSQAELAQLACPNELKNDPYLSQLNWTPKKARHFKWATLESMSRTGDDEQADETGRDGLSKPRISGGGGSKSSGVLPKSRMELAQSKVIPNSIGLLYQGCPVVWSVEHGWIYKRDPVDPVAAAMEPASDAVRFSDDRDSFLGSQARETDRKKRVTFHRLPNPAKSTKVTRCLGKAFLNKFGCDLSCQDERLLQMIIVEADWQEIEDRLRDHLKGSGMLSGLQTAERTVDTPAERSRADDTKASVTPSIPDAPVCVGLPGSFDELSKNKSLPAAVNLRFDGHPIVWSFEHGFVFSFNLTKVADGSLEPPEDAPLIFKDARDSLLSQADSTLTFHKLPSAGKASKVTRCLGKVFAKKYEARLSSDVAGLLAGVANMCDWPAVAGELERVLSMKQLLVNDRLTIPSTTSSGDSVLEPTSSSNSATEVVRDYMTASGSARQAYWWPQWYHELFAPNVNRPWDMMNFSIRNTVATLLLQLSWRGYPLFKSRQYGWVFRMPIAEANAEDEDRSRRLLFSAGQEAFNQREEEADLEAMSEKRPAAGGAGKKLNPDLALFDASCAGEYAFFQVPHPNGEGNNVGYVTSKPFIKFIEDETLTSVYPLAKEAMQMNVACSYWISVRERVVEQLAIRQSTAMPMGFPTNSTSATTGTADSTTLGSSLATGPADNDEGYGVILPQVIVMGTITRRAIEKTWLTASNAKKNRVGSELKAMIQAPEGFNIVGADVDSEELWIASLLGDAQLGMHGASAIGWMTLEGTKAQGTDVHSKTASIVNITRDMAKVFNYSRIYGAGVANATRLLLDGMKEPDIEHAEAAARRLYLSTKGDRVPRKSREFHSFWFGGSESYLFNSIEQVARSRRPTTPALGCGVTAALREEFLTNKEDHMTSRINWVVQSSGVDYLHLLIVAVNRLCKLYDIEARYLLSVHDEVRYLCREEDRYRLALALQIANLWTRSLFARKLGMEDLPQGCAFFSEVDVDKVLRKEVSMPCVTPSNPEPIAPGEALSIDQVLEKTGASLYRDGRPSSDVAHPPLPSSEPSSSGLYPPRPYQDRASAIAAAAASTYAPATPTSHIRADPTQLERWRRFFLQAQALKTESDIKAAWEHYGRPPDPVRAYRQRSAGPDGGSNPWAKRGGRSFDTSKKRMAAGADGKPVQQHSFAINALGGPPPMMRRA